MSELKLYVMQDVDFGVSCPNCNATLDNEDENEDDAKSQAVNKLESNGVYDVNYSTSPVHVESVSEVE